MMQPTAPTDQPHEHLCIHCGRWSRVITEEPICPRCSQPGPAIHNAAQLLTTWGLNVFFEEQGVNEGVLDPAWSIRLKAGSQRDEVVLEVLWTSADPAATKRLLTRWSKAVGFDPVPRYRLQKSIEGLPIFAGTDVSTLASFGHPAGLYREVAQKIVTHLALFSALGEAKAKANQPHLPKHLLWAVEWLARFVSAPPAVDPQRLGERYCPRCFHDQAGYFEPMCSYFRDTPEVAWGAGSEPWYDLMLAASELFGKPEHRESILSGPEGGVPPVPLEGPEPAFALIGSVVAHLRPRRCPGYVSTRKMQMRLRAWSHGENTLIDVAKETLDPVIVAVAGEKMGEWLTELLEGVVSPAERKVRSPEELVFATTRLQNLAEWISAGALDGPRGRLVRGS